MDNPYYVCPNCQSQKLSVTVAASAKVVQREGFVYTEVADVTDEDHEWDLSHTMWCDECNHADAASSFQVRKEPK